MDMCTQTPFLAFAGFCCARRAPRPRQRWRFLPETSTMPAFDPVRDALNSPLSPSHPPPSPFTRPSEAPHYSSSPLASPSIGKRATDLSVLLNDDPPPLTRTPSSRSASLAHLVHQTEPEDKLAYSDPLRRGQSSRDDDGYFAHRPSSSSSRTSLSLN